MTTRLEKIMRWVESLPQAEQDAIAAQIHDSLDNSSARRAPFDRVADHGWVRISPF